MQWRGHLAGLGFSITFIVSYFTNKFVLSVLKFRFPTLFQGWQTLVGAVLLLLSGRLGWVEMSRISRSTAVSWLPGSLMFLGSIYAGSRALSHMVTCLVPGSFLSWVLIHFIGAAVPVKLNSGFPLEEGRAWAFLSKVTTVTLSPLVFPLNSNIPSLTCVFSSLAGEALLLYSDVES
ncbi:hypothetical protein CRUP_016966 [Coryphaenoides rupestris]|nr:hypothetical protein CRUP_016966 [Coryphaenoides rupestris]